MPVSVKWSLIGGVALLCLGAAYLLIERGPAILLDLQGAVNACF